MTITPSDLYRRFSEKVERRKEIRLSPDELDLFVIMGGLDAISKYAAEWIRKQAEERVAARRAERAEAMDAAYTARYPKPHPNPEMEAARRSAWELTQPKSRPRTR